MEITAMEGVRVYHKSYIRAADAPTMKKRAHSLFEGMWSLEEQLTVDSMNRNSYKLITKEELNTLKSKFLNVV